MSDRDKWKMLHLLNVFGAPHLTSEQLGLQRSLRFSTKAQRGRIVLFARPASRMMSTRIEIRAASHSSGGRCPSAGPSRHSTADSNGCEVLAVLFQLRERAEHLKDGRRFLGNGNGTLPRRRSDRRGRLANTAGII